MTRSDCLDLLFADWQGFGESAEVHHGARRLAGALWQGREFVTIDVPGAEILAREDGVLGLAANLRLLQTAGGTLRDHDPARVFMIGGTCAAEIGPVSFLNRKYDSNLAVLWFDAHGDLNTPESSPSGHLHGMPLRTLLGEGVRCPMAATRKAASAVLQLPRQRGVFRAGRRVAAVHQ